MNRLVHLKETLPINIDGNLNYPNVEFVILDYNSPDGLEQHVYQYWRKYIDQGILHYYKTTEPTVFHMSHAKNVAALLARGEVVVNVDADSFIGPGFVAFTAETMRKTTNGMCRCSRIGKTEETGDVRGELRFIKTTSFRLADMMNRCEAGGGKTRICGNGSKCSIGCQ